MRRLFGTKLYEACFEPEDSGIKRFCGGYCGDSVIKMRYQVGFHLRYELRIFRSSLVTIFSRRFRVCVSKSNCLHHVRTGFSQHGQSGMKDFPVRLSLIACK